MKMTMVNLGLIYIGGFVFYCAVVLWFNRPNLRRQLRVLHNLNDSNVSYSNGLNATIRDLRDAAVEQGNVISMYDEAAGDSRRKINKLENQVAHHNITINEYNKLLNESQTAVNEAQVEIRNAAEALEFLKSEVEMAERRVESLNRQYIVQVEQNVTDMQIEKEFTNNVIARNVELANKNDQLTLKCEDNEATIAYYKSQVEGSTRV